MVIPLTPDMANRFSKIAGQVLYIKTLVCGKLKFRLCPPPPPPGSATEYECAYKKVFLDAVVEVRYEKNQNFAIFRSKMVQNDAHGNLEIGHMQHFLLESYFNPNGSFSHMG